jgi:uncharacterized beta-barrel protein YwiB (DUF1934 family)
MKKPVLLTICGKQYYPNQEPEVIELMTEGTLEYRDGGWDICYEESELTGMAGVTTSFRLEPGTVILERTGKLQSQMIFRLGIPHESLYQMDFGALMLTVCAQMIEATIDENGGTVDLGYSIAIENNDAGLVEYHLEVRPKM